MRRTPFRAAAVTVGALALAVGPLAAPASAATFEIQLIGISEFHGRLEPIDETDDGQPVGGASQLAGAIEELSASFGGDTLAVASGDNIGASTFTSNAQQDAPTIEALDAMGLAASSVGNHEFDQGYDDIATGGRVDTLADFPYLGANVYARGTQDPVFEESVTLTTQDGVQIAFIGVVTEETPSLVAPDGVAQIEFGDEAEAVNRVADELASSANPPDVVVALSHSGSSTAECADVAATPLVAGANGSVDVILNGHTGQQYACDVAGGGGFEGPVVQGGQYGEAISVVEISYDDVSGDVDAAARVEPVVGYDSTNEAVNQIVADAVAFAEEAGAEPLGEITADITRAFDDAGAEDRGAESDLGNFIATVQLDQTQVAGAQIAFMNPGGLRDDFLVEDIFGSEAPGVVTLGEANAVQPFANGVVTMTLTGQQIKDVLEEQYQPDGSSRAFLALGVSEGFLFSTDPDAPRGERITGASLNGELLDLDAEYRVTVNSFLASGGDNFTTLAEGTDRQELGVSDLQALTAYLDENSPVTADTESNRVAEALGFASDGGGTPPPPGGGAGGDDDDRTCADFATQAEAQAALVAGNSSLDGDNDGTACDNGVGRGAGGGGADGAGGAGGAGSGGGATGGQNRGLSVDTGVTGSNDTQVWALAGLLLMLSAGGAVAFRRRGAVR